MQRGRNQITQWLDHDASADQQLDGGEKRYGDIDNEGETKVGKGPIDGTTCVDVGR